MSGVGVPSSNPVPGAEQNSYYNSDPRRNHLQANNLGKHGAVMHGNFSQVDGTRAPQNPYGVESQGLKTATNASQFEADNYQTGATTMANYSNMQYSPHSNTRQAGPPQTRQPYQGAHSPNQPQNYYSQGVSTSLPNGPPMQGMSQLNGTNTSNTASSQGLLSAVLQPVSSATSSPSQPASIGGPQTVNRNSPMSVQRNQAMQSNQSQASSGSRPQMQQMHSGSAFSPVTGARPVQQNTLAMPAAATPGSTAQPTTPATLPVNPPSQTSGTLPVSPPSQSPGTLPVSPSSQSPGTLPVSPPSQSPGTLPVSPPFQTPATLPVSPPSQSPGSHRSTPSPKPLSALHSGKPKRPGLPVAPTAGYPGGHQGVPQRPTPPSSGPSTPSGLPSTSMQSQTPPTSYPGTGAGTGTGAGADSSASSASRPSIMSKRRQYPTQQPPTLPGPAGQGYPGQMPGQVPGQIPGQVPGQMPGQIPSQVPGQMPGQMPGQVPGQMPGEIPGQMPGQMPGSIQGPHGPQTMVYSNRGQGSQMPGYSGLEGPMNRLTVQQNSGVQPVNLLEQKNIVPTTPLEHTAPPLPSDLQKRNTDSSVLCCTLNSIPETKGLLTKSRLPFAIHLHPFRDLASLPVIHSSVITRCRSCRTYINPFVTFTETRRWRCSMCFRTNEVPDEFCYDPSTKSYGDPSRRPEIKSATVEFIAPSEYMLRPPQPAVFLFMFDVSFNAIETGYLHSACKILKENLDKMPGDSRTLVGFITFDSKLHFYSLRPKSAQPQMLIVSDLDDVFLPAPDDLVVNLKENMELIHQLLDTLPTMFQGTHNVHSATGAAMQAALKLIGPTGGRVSVFQTTLPNIGPGELKRREEPNQKSNPKDVVNLAPATDFYKKFALDCAAEQVAIDLFLLASQYSDISSLMCASKYSGGCISYYQDFHVVRNLTAVEKFESEFARYLSRKIGFEAVMRVRCTRGLTIHTFHGNFFVRSTDLVSLPNINPDTGFTMQIDIEDTLSDSNVVCFQSALLYTSSRGERRIRVHTLAMPTTTKLADVYAYADQQAVGILLAKMAVDRTLSSSLGDAREALMNSCVDFMTVYRQHVANQPQSSQLLAPYSLRLLPLYVLALLKNVAFRLGSTARLDERCFAMQQFKTMPVNLCMLTLYPALYPLHDISEENGLHTKEGVVPQPLRYNLSAEKLSRQGVFLMDAGNVFYIWVGKETPNEIIQQMFNVPSFNNIAENMGALPELENALNQRVRCFIDYLQSQRNCHAVLHVFREDSRNRTLFLNNLVDDRAESVMSYYEFLVHLQRQVNK